MVTGSLQLLSYGTARRLIRNGDLLLWRPTNAFGRVIAAVTKSEYSHVGMAGWVFDDVLLCLQMIQWEGGSPKNLSLWVAQYPGKCDVYRLRRMHGRIAAQAMARRIGSNYGAIDFVHIITRRLFAWACKHEMHTAPFDHPLVCSGAVADACRRGGVNVADQKPVWAVTPADLAKEAEYVFTLA